MINFYYTHFWKKIASTALMYLLCMVCKLNNKGSHLRCSHLQHISYPSSPKAISREKKVKFPEEINETIDTVEVLK